MRRRGLCSRGPRSGAAATSRSILFDGPPEALHENLAAQAGRLPRLDARGARARPRRRAALGDGGLQPRQLRRDGGRGRDLLRGGARRPRRGLARDRAPRRPRRDGRGRSACAARAVDAALEGLRSRGLPVWIGNVNASTQFVLTGRTEGVAAALDALRPRALSVLPLDDELADPQRAHAAGRRGDRAARRRACRPSATRTCRTTVRKGVRWPAGKTCAVSSEPRSAFRRSGRTRSSASWPTARRPSSRPVPARCSRGWRAGSIGRRVAVRRARSRRSAPSWI